MNKRFWYFALVIPGAVSMLLMLISNPLEGLPWALAGYTAFLGGAVLAWRVPSNIISWLLLGGGTSLVVSYLMVLYLDSLDVTATSYAWGEAIFYVFSTAGVMLFPIILLRFPDGTHQSRRWKYVEWAAILAAFVGAAAALMNGGWGGDVTQATVVSPLRESTEPYGDMLSQLFYILFLLTFGSSAFSLIIRYRSSTGESRLQIKYLAIAAVYIIVALGLIFADSGFQSVQTDKVWEEWLGATAFSSIPIAIGLAVLRYRLYDIDVVISRTVVLAMLAGFITITYALIVVGIGRLIGGDNDRLLLPIAATALVAVAFEPVRLRAQRWANRLVFGSKATPYEVLSDLTQRLSTAESGADLLQRLADLLREGTGAEVATVWLGESGRMSVVAVSPLEVIIEDQPDLDGEKAVAVILDGEIVGAVGVQKQKGNPLSSEERALLSDLAGSAGAVLGHRRINDSLAAKADELERSRARLVGAQDLERRRLERDLHEGAEQYIVALKVKLGVATQLARKHDAEQMVSLLDGLTADAQAALDDVQNLAKGIYPPILESDGLGPAISALVTASPVEIQFERQGVGRYPSDVEAAVYFDISEAVTNAVKHADPPIRIELSQANGSLSFAVVDAGPGFDIEGLEKGSGLENMADRLAAVGGSLTIESANGMPTVVSGAVPVTSADPGR